MSQKWADNKCQQVNFHLAQHFNHICDYTNYSIHTWVLYETRIHHITQNEKEKEKKNESENNKTALSFIECYQSYFHKSETRQPDDVRPEMAWQSILKYLFIIQFIVIIYLYIYFLSYLAASLNFCLTSCHRWPCATDDNSKWLFEIDGFLLSVFFFVFRSSTAAVVIFLVILSFQTRCP